MIAGRQIRPGYLQFKRASRYLALLGSLLLTGMAGADERILNYSTEVMVHPGGELTVSEEIRVRAEGNEIRRGIYREFPTSYTDRYGNHYTVEFGIDSILRDGQPESWHTEEMSNGVRVYIGSADHFLDPAEYTYRIQFHTNRQLGFFADHDELYWNVTGSDWAFPIDKTSARISLPFSIAADQLELDVYTGVSGSQGTDGLTRVIDARTVEFATTRQLAPREGFTVVLSWPKGLIAEPSGTQKVLWFVRDNSASLVLGLGLVLSFLWYGWAWNKIGRDPAKGLIIPQFKAPDGISPSACRYLLDMGFRNQAFTAAIISLAVKGHIRIEEEDKEFTLHRVIGRAPLHSGSGQLTRTEESVLDAMLPKGTSSIAMTNANHAKFQAARKALEQSLKKEYQGHLFHLNTLYVAPPVIFTGLSVFVALAFGSSPLIWISWGLLVLLLHGLFVWLLRAPTPAGRQAMDEIEGFRMYLDTAEQDRLDRMRSPALTPEVFESFLPYAYALGVENHWCERFARELPREVPGEASQANAYQPAWYSGNYQGMGALNHLGSNFSNSFSTAISSASTPPGSSSGSSGGGSSGGGGGGGGGGGW